MKTNPPVMMSPSLSMKKFGMLGFLFFLCKGLLWLIVPGLVAYFGL